MVRLSNPEATLATSGSGIVAAGTGGQTIAASLGAFSTAWMGTVTPNVLSVSFSVSSQTHTLAPFTLRHSPIVMRDVGEADIPTATAASAVAATAPPNLFCHNDIRPPGRWNGPTAGLVIGRWTTIRECIHRVSGRAHGAVRPGMDGRPARGPEISPGEPGGPRATG